MPKWCWGAEHGVNEAGVAMGNETIYTTNDPRTAPPALIGMDLVRLALERAASAVEAVHVVSEMINTYGQGGSGHDTSNGERARPYWSSFLIADSSDAWVVETSGNVVEAMQVTRTCPLRESYWPQIQSQPSYCNNTCNLM
jgi:dipeptidase